MVISSRSNSKIKQIRSLRIRKNRERTGLFFVDGIRLVAEASQSAARIEALIVAPELLRSSLGQEIVREQLTASVPCFEVNQKVYESLAPRDATQGIGATVRQRWETLDRVRLADERSWVAVDAIQNPGNLGTILRTSAAVGGAGVILIGPATDPYDPSAVRASLGAIFSQHLVRTTLSEFAAWKQQYAAGLVGTSPAAATDYKAVAYQPPLVLFMGSERRGLSPEMQAICDLVVRIPMTGRCDSLNLGVATSILLYEIFNQQRMASRR